MMADGVKVRTLTEYDQLSALDCGRLLAMCTAAERQIQPWAAAHGDLFTGIAGPVVLSRAFASPWTTLDQLVLISKLALWAFAVDTSIDNDAQSADDVAEVVSRCLTVVDGGPPVPGDPLTRALSDIHDQLVKTPMYDSLRDLWRDLLELSLRAMEREWHTVRAISRGGPQPTLAEYLDNCDNLALRWVRVSWWIVSETAELLDHLDTMLPPLWVAQTALRFSNDLASHQRERANGDINLFTMGYGQAEIIRRRDELMSECHRMLSPLMRRGFKPAIDVDRAIKIAVAFYDVTDFRTKN